VRAFVPSPVQGRPRCHKNPDVRLVQRLATHTGGADLGPLPQLRGACGTQGKIFRLWHFFSSQHYPIRPLESIAKFLTDHKGKQFIEAFRLNLHNRRSIDKGRHQGLGESEPKGAHVLASRINPPHAQTTLQSGLKSPGRLLSARTFRTVSFYQIYALADRPECGTATYASTSARILFRTS
jgi:hypothetical protein